MQFTAKFDFELVNFCNVGRCHVHPHALSVTSDWVCVLVLFFSSIFLYFTNNKKKTREKKNSISSLVHIVLKMNETKDSLSSIRRRKTQDENILSCSHTNQNYIIVNDDVHVQFISFCLFRLPVDSELVVIIAKQLLLLLLTNCKQKQISAE